MKPLEMIESYADFLTHTRVFFLMQRRKDVDGAPHDHMVRSVVKKISRNASESVGIIEEMLETVRTGTHQRLYVSVNSRDINKAIREFKHRQLDHDYHAEDVRQDFYCDIKNRWISCLMQPSARASTRFLFDCDSVEQIAALENKLARSRIEVFGRFDTKNGQHVVTAPHDPRLTAVDGVTAAKDGLLLISWSEQWQESRKPAEGEVGE